MTAREWAAACWQELSAGLRWDRKTALSTVTAWLEHHGAEMPEAPLMHERIRHDARMWADCATPHELEAYVVAGVSELGQTPLTEKQMKRLIANIWRRMPEDVRADFIKWTGTTDK